MAESSLCSYRKIFVRMSSVVYQTFYFWKLYCILSAWLLVKFSDNVAILRYTTIVYVDIQVMHFKLGVWCVFLDWVCIPCFAVQVLWFLLSPSSPFIYYCDDSLSCTWSVLLKWYNTLDEAKIRQVLNHLMSQLYKTLEYFLWLKHNCLHSIFNRARIIHPK